MSKIREKIIAERQGFIRNWCKERNLDPMYRDNYEKAAAEWAFINCFSQ